jgi:hypothetical protein
LGPLELKDATGFRIVDRETISDDRQIITIYVDPLGEMSLPLIRTPPNGPWKIGKID